MATGHAETAERAAREIGCAVWTDDYRTLLARDDVHVVDICTPNHAHEVAVLAAVGAGKHVYVEKPLALDVAQARRMAQAVSGTKLKGQVTFNFRFTPAVVRARQLMAAGFTGRVFSFHTRYNRSSYIAPEKPLSWRLSREAAGGGALFDLGSHALDLVHFLLGEVSRSQRYPGNAHPGTAHRAWIDDQSPCGRRRSRPAATAHGGRHAGCRRGVEDGHRRDQRSPDRNLRRIGRPSSVIQRTRLAVCL